MIQSQAGIDEQAVALAIACNAPSGPFQMAFGLGLAKGSLRAGEVHRAAVGGAGRRGGPGVGAEIGIAQLRADILEFVGRGLEGRLVKVGRQETGRQVLRRHVDGPAGARRRILGIGPGQAGGERAQGQLHFGAELAEAFPRRGVKPEQARLDVVADIGARAVEQLGFAALHRQRQLRGVIAQVLAHGIAAAIIGRRHRIGEDMRHSVGVAIQPRRIGRL